MEGYCAWDADYNRSPSPFPGALSPALRHTPQPLHHQLQQNLQQQHLQSYSIQEEASSYGYGTQFVASTSTKSRTFENYEELQPLYDAQFVFPQGQDFGVPPPSVQVQQIPVQQQQFQQFQQVKSFEEAQKDAERLAEFQTGIYTLQDEREQMQVKTFTKWINSHLAKVSSNMRITSVLEDFQDGVKLLALLQVLSGVRLPVEKGRRRCHHLCNFDTALKFLEWRKVKLVNINTSDLVEGRPSVVLGLVWAIILHFQIEGSPEHSPKGEKLSAKQALLEWVRGLFREKGITQEVKDFSGSWRDGWASLHLLNCVCKNPNGLLNVMEFNGATNIQRLESSFKVAEERLGIPKLLDPQDVEARPDEQSIMTYVAQFYAKWNSGTFETEAPPPAPVPVPPPPPPPQPEPEVDMAAELEKAAQLQRLNEYESLLKDAQLWLNSASDKLTQLQISPNLSSGEIEGFLETLNGYRPSLYNLAEKGELLIQGQPELMAQITSQVGDISDKYNGLLAAGAELKQRLLSAQAEAERQAREASLNEEKLQALNKAKQELSDCFKRFQQALDEIKNRPISLKTEALAGETSEILKIQGELQQCQGKLAELQSLGLGPAEAAELASQLGSIDKEAESVRQKRAQLYQQIQDFLNALENTCGWLDGFECRAQAKPGSISEVQSLLQELEGTGLPLLAGLKIASEKILPLELLPEERSFVQGKTGEVEERFGRVKLHLEGEIEILEAQESSQKKLQNFLNELNKFKGTLTGFKGKLEGLKRQKIGFEVPPAEKALACAEGPLKNDLEKEKAELSKLSAKLEALQDPNLDQNELNKAKKELEKAQKDIQAASDDLKALTVQLQEGVSLRFIFQGRAPPIRTLLSKVAELTKDKQFPLEEALIKGKRDALSKLEKEIAELERDVLPQLKNEAGTLENDCDEEQTFRLKQFLSELDLSGIPQLLKGYDKQCGEAIGARLAYKEGFAKCLKGLEEVNGDIKKLEGDLSSQSDPNLAKQEIENQLKTAMNLQDRCGELNILILNLINDCSTSIFPNLTLEDNPVLKEKLKSLSDSLSGLQGRLQEKTKGLKASLEDAKGLEAIAEEARKFLDSLKDHLAALQRPVNDFGKDTVEDYLSAYDKLLQELKAYRDKLEKEPCLQGLSRNPDLIAMTSERESLVGLLEGEIARLQRLHQLQQEYLRLGAELSSLILVYADITRKIEGVVEGGDIPSKVKLLEETLGKIKECEELLGRVVQLGRKLAEEVKEEEGKAITEQTLPSLGNQVEALKKAVKDKIAEYLNRIEQLKKLSEEMKGALKPLKDQEIVLNAPPNLEGTLEEVLKKEEGFCGDVEANLGRLKKIIELVSQEDLAGLPEELKKDFNEAKIIKERFPKELEARRGYLLLQKRLREVFRKECQPIQEWISESKAKLEKVSGAGLDFDNLEGVKNICNSLTGPHLKEAMEQRLQSLKDLASQIAPASDHDKFFKEQEDLVKSTENIFSSAGKSLSVLDEVKSLSQAYQNSMEVVNRVILKATGISQEVPATNLPALQRNLVAVEKAEALLLQAGQKGEVDFEKLQKLIQSLGKISPGSLDKLQGQVLEGKKRWEETSKNLQGRRGLILKLLGEWEEYEKLCKRFDTALTSAEIAFSKLDPITKNAEQLEEKIGTLKKLQGELAQLEPIHGQLLQAFPTWATGSPEILPELLKSHVDHVCVNFTRLGSDLKTSLECFEAQKVIFEEVNRKVNGDQQILQTLGKDLEGLDPFSKDQQSLQGKIQEIQGKLQRSSSEITSLDSFVKDKFSQWGQPPPGIILRGVSNLGLELDKVKLAFEDKNRAVNEARALLATFQKELDNLKGWVKCAETQMQVQSSQNPLDQQKALEALSSQLPRVLHDLDKVTEMVKVISSRAGGTPPGGLAILEDTSGNILRLKGLIEEWRVKVEKCLESWQRFMEMYGSVMEWARKSNQFLRESFLPSGLEEMREKLGNYTLSLKTVEGAAAKLSSMGKEIDKVAEVSSASPLYQKLDEAEQAKTDVEGRLVERTSLLQETVDEWEQLNLKFKEVESWLLDSKQAMETAQLTSVSKLRATREKLLADVRVQKTKIGMASQKLLIHVKAISKEGNPKDVQAEQKTLEKQLDELEDTLKAMDFSSPR